MSFRATAILYVLATLLQMSIVNLISIHGVGPNLILCLTIALTFMFNGGYKAAPFAVICTLFLDIGTAQYIGTGAFTIFVIMGIILLIRRELNVENIFPLLTVGVIITVAYGIIYWIIMRILGSPMSFIYMLWHQPFYVAYNLAILAILYFSMAGKLKVVKNHRNRAEYEQD